MIKCRWFFLGMRNVSDKSYREKQTGILCPITFYGTCAFYEITWKNMVLPDRRQRQYNTALKGCDLHAALLRQEWRYILTHLILIKSNTKKETIIAFPWQHSTLFHCWELYIHPQQWLFICGSLQDVISSPVHTASDKKINLKGTATP
jgi:hypothetical protein